MCTQLLKVFSLASSYVLRTGRLSLDLVARLVRFFTGALSSIASCNNALDTIYERTTPIFLHGFEMLSRAAPKQVSGIRVGGYVHIPA